MKLVYSAPSFALLLLLLLLLLRMVAIAIIISVLTLYGLIITSEIRLVYKCPICKYVFNVTYTFSEFNVGDICL